MISWVYLFIAILFEIAGTMCLKLSEGFTRILPSVLIFVFYTIAFVLVTLAIRKIELSTAYTVWAGMGTAVIAAIGIFYFGEQASALKLTSIALVVLGVAGLKLSAT